MILVCVSWLSESPGEVSAAVQNSGRVFLFARRKKINTKPETGKEMNSVCAFLV